MEAYPRIFNNMYLSMIKAGERSGTLDEVLYRMAEYREREQELEKRSERLWPILFS